MNHCVGARRDDDTIVMPPRSLVQEAEVHYQEYVQVLAYVMDALASLSICKNLQTALRDKFKADKRRQLNLLWRLTKHAGFDGMWCVVKRGGEMDMGQERGPMTGSLCAVILISCCWYTSFCGYCSPSSLLQ